jgi:hypothetical protein
MISSDLNYRAGLARIDDLRREAQTTRYVKPARAGPNRSPSAARRQLLQPSPQPRRALISSSAGAWPATGHIIVPRGVIPVTGRFLPVPSRRR